MLIVWALASVSKLFVLQSLFLSCECQKKNTWKINQLNLYLSPQNQGQENLFFHTISSLNSNSLETLGLKEPEVKESASKNDSYVIYILFHSDKKKKNILKNWTSFIWIHPRQQPVSAQIRPHGFHVGQMWAGSGPTLCCCLGYDCFIWRIDWNLVISIFLYIKAAVRKFCLFVGISFWNLQLQLFAELFSLRGLCVGTAP